MSDINELKDRVNTKTLNFVLLTLATMGIYPIIWLAQNYKIIDEVTTSKTATDTYVIWVAVCIGFSGIFSGTGEVLFDLISSILSLSASVLYLVWAFRARRALREYALSVHNVDLKMNPVYTFFFTMYYINYCINSLPNEQKKFGVLNG